MFERLYMWSKHLTQLERCCGLCRRGFPALGKFFMNSLRLKKGKGKKLGEEEVTMFIFTVVTSSLVHVAGVSVFRRPATGSAPSTSFILRH